MEQTRELRERVYGLEQECVWKEVATAQQKQDRTLMIICRDCSGYEFNCEYYFARKDLARGKLTK